MLYRISFLLLLFSTFAPSPPAENGVGTTYYFSSSTGDDGNAGTSPTSPFATINKANSLALNPGDQLLFQCGDLWQGEAIHVEQSGNATAPIRYGSYPTVDCPDKPILSGSLPISGWAMHQPNIYVADLNGGGNAGNFPAGINQLFQNDQRLPMGRYPNIDAADGGYASVTAQPNLNEIEDATLPAVDWTGGVVHLKGMRWYILNREILTDTGNTLTLNANVHCYGGGCNRLGLLHQQPFGNARSGRGMVLR